MHATLSCHLRYMHDILGNDELPKLEKLNAAAPKGCMHLRYNENNV